MLNQKKENHQCCIILDLPGEDRKTVSEFFCYEINHGTYQKLRFALYAIKNEPRVILSGNTEEILSLVHKYYESKKT